MKVKIKNYPDFYGSGVLIDKLPISAEWQDRLQGWVPEWYDVLANKLVKWQGDRRTQIHIDNYDTWNMDGTLAHMVLPMLKILKRDKQGAPNVNFEDVPKRLRPTKLQAAKAKKEGDVDVKHFKRWDWIMDEMIFAFESYFYDWEDQFTLVPAEIDFSDHPEDEDKEFVEIRWKVEGEYDWKGRAAYQARITNGLRLFGTYYQCLWD